LDAQIDYLVRLTSPKVNLVDMALAFLGCSGK
jgi:hypothetical protein